MIAQRLEGSRFGAYLATLATFVSSLVRPKRAKTSGSRRMAPSLAKTVQMFMWSARSTLPG